MTFDNPTITAEQCRRRFAALVAFCQSAGRQCYAGYSPEVLQDYLAFHLEQCSLKYVLSPESGQIIGCAVVWRTGTDNIVRRDAERKLIFNWQPDDPQGDALFIADVVCTAPGAAMSLFAALAERYPNAGRLKWFSYRHNKLVRLHPASIFRMLSQEKE